MIDPFAFLLTIRNLKGITSSIFCRKLDRTGPFSLPLITERPAILSINMRSYSRSSDVRTICALWLILSTDAFLHPIHQRAHSFLPATPLPSVTVALLKPAAEHTQPLWGPPDPYLAAGKSIAPSAKALAEMGIAPTDLPANSVLDGAAIHAQTLLPGFSPTRGILPGHVMGLPAETPETFAAQVEWSARFLNVIDQVPTIVFAYALVEFFLLRPNLDLYQEEIRDQPTQIMTGTVAVTGVRVGVFCVIAILTCTVFG